MLGFPAEFKMPRELRLMHRYKTAGNSIGVTVCAELLRYLLFGESEERLQKLELPPPPKQILSRDRQRPPVVKLETAGKRLLEDALAVPEAPPEPIAFSTDIDMEAPPEPVDAQAGEPEDLTMSSATDGAAASKKDPRSPKSSKGKKEPISPKSPGKGKREISSTEQGARNKQGDGSPSRKKATVVSR